VLPSEHQEACARRSRRQARAHRLATQKNEEEALGAPANAE